MTSEKRIIVAFRFIDISILLPLAVSLPLLLTSNSLVYSCDNLVYLYVPTCTYTGSEISVVKGFIYLTLRSVSISSTDRIIFIDRN